MRSNSLLASPFHQFDTRGEKFFCFFFFKKRSACSLTYPTDITPDAREWNLTRLAECLLLLIDETVEVAIEQVQEDLATFGARFEDAYTAGLRRKLGLMTAQDGDLALAEALLERMAANAADFTLTFRALCEAADDTPGSDAAVRACFADPAAFDTWAAGWRERQARETVTPGARVALMRAANPAIIPRNHRIEAAIQAAVGADDFAPFHALLDALASPYADHAIGPDTMPPLDDQRVTQTFCGT